MVLFVYKTCVTWDTPSYTKRQILTRPMISMISQPSYLLMISLQNHKLLWLTPQFVAGQSLSLVASIPNSIWLVVDLPLWKIMELKSVGMMTFPTYGKIANLPNHQPAIGASWITIFVGLPAFATFPRDGQGVAPGGVSGFIGTWNSAKLIVSIYIYIFIYINIVTIYI